MWRVAIACLCLGACAKGSGPIGEDPDAPPGTADGPPLPIPDAPPGTVDAPEMIDSMIAAPDAAVDASPPDAGCTIQQQQVFVNPNFDSGAVGWVEFPFDPGYPLITTDVPGGVSPFSAPFIVWMGGFLDATDRMYQQYAVPATATAMEIRGYRWIATEELIGEYDFVFVEVRSTSDALLQTVTSWSNEDSSGGWTAFTLPVAGSYAGQTIRIQLRSTTDFSYNTNFLFDNVGLYVTACL